MKKNKYVITITRQTGSMGRLIAQKMSEKLGVDYYDRDLVDQAAKKLKFPVSLVDTIEETAKKIKTDLFFGMGYSLGKETSTAQDKIFNAQQDIIRFLAESEACIIVGRCADFALSDVENSMHIYIYAPYEVRVQNCMKELNLDIGEARKLIVAIDEARESYHMNYAGYMPDDIRHKQIMIDSSLLGVEGTADYLAEAVKRKFG